MIQVPMALLWMSFKLVLQPVSNAPWWKNLGQDIGSILRRQVSQGEDYKGRALRGPGDMASLSIKHTHPHRAHLPVEDMQALVPIAPPEVSKPTLGV